VADFEPEVGALLKRATDLRCRPRLILGFTEAQQVDARALAKNMKRRSTIWLKRSDCVSCEHGRHQSYSEVSSQHWQLPNTLLVRSLLDASAGEKVSPTDREHRMYDAIPVLGQRVAG
jgi:hypothetical protein